ncbi:GntR family transcriptional regulator [Nonomuraea ceibae]|uniref:GntR family transcriptional regulator n=1 Tax=Nonomuraea ceibae TaxID=1935170 RepID=UPI001C5FF273|nr:GntR family transcriptional regulator [Nonomuraea ceibae]
MPEPRATWKVGVDVYATEEQARELQKRIELLLCPEPEHVGPCPVPWSSWRHPGGGGGDGDGGLAEQYVLERLRERVVTGGETRLPSRPALRKEYGVGRAAVDRAIRKLEEAGLVETVRGRGTFAVRRPA